MLRYIQVIYFQWNYISMLMYLFLPMYEFITYMRVCMHVCRFLDIRLFYNSVSATEIIKPQIKYGSIVICLWIRNDLTGNYRGTLQLTNSENLAEENQEISVMIAGLRSEFEACASQTSHRWANQFYFTQVCIVTCMSDYRRGLDW
jgi:hypothetical protein